MSNTNHPNQQLNIEQMFTHLKLQWQAPSPKTAEGFTQLSNRLAGLMSDLQNSPLLEFLDKQFYPEWRVLNRKHTSSAIDHENIFSLSSISAAEFRQGFYFCNRLIELMEDVYLDLDLEAYYDHPDNRGWINLFRHWSWSAMFQASWTISACTYGIRFQRFCRHHLDLELGKVTTSTIANDQIDACTLNAFELLQVKAIYNIYQKQQANLQLYLMNLQVASPVPSENNEFQPLIPVFNFGYAIIDTQKNTILMFRVQDHLRKLGLGNAGLLNLISVQSKVSRQALKMEPGYLTYFNLKSDQDNSIDINQSIANDDENLSTMLCNSLFNRDISKQSIAQFLRILDSTKAKHKATFQ